MYESLFPDLPKDDIETLLTPPAPPMMGPDGQPVDPALVQGDAQMTPGATALMASEGESTGASQYSKATQSGTQGGGGADSSSNNIRRTRSNQPSTKLNTSAKPKTSR
jgi:hypothetical protein